MPLRFDRCSHGRSSLACANNDGASLRRCRQASRKTHFGTRSIYGSVKKRVQELSWIINHRRSFWHGVSGLATDIAIRGFNSAFWALEPVGRAWRYELVPREHDPL